MSGIVITKKGILSILFLNNFKHHGPETAKGGWVQPSGWQQERLMALRCIRKSNNFFLIDKRKVVIVDFRSL